MALADGGKQEEAARRLAGGGMAALGVRSGELLRDWIAHNQKLASSAGDATVVDLEAARRHNRIALVLALIVSGGLGFLTFRKIVGPVRGLQGSVEAIAGGAYDAAWLAAPPVGSVCGGGRYDELIGMFADKQIPAVGLAIGFDRTIEAMDALELFPVDIALSSTKVLVTVFSDMLKEKSFETLAALRAKKINAEIYLGEIKPKAPLEKQLKYADNKNIPYVLVIGPQEAEKNIVTLKNMKTREQVSASLEEILHEYLQK
jgi:hypothetical protein